MTVHLHIDRLVLDGVQFGPGDQRRLAASLRAELTRLLTASPPPFTSGAHASLPAPDLPQPASDPARLGRQLAAAIHRSLGGARP